VARVQRADVSGAWRRHAQVREVAQTVSLNHLSLDFSLAFEKKVPQTLNSKVIKQITLYNNAKGSRVFTHWFEHKLQGKLGKNSALVNSKPAPCFAFFTTLHYKLAMPIFMKVVCLAKLHIFPIGWF
jgi:hypothetical protein